MLMGRLADVRAIRCVLGRPGSQASAPYAVAQSLYDFQGLPRPEAAFVAVCVRLQALHPLSTHTMHRAGEAVEPTDTPALQLLLAIMKLQSFLQLRPAFGPAYDQLA